MNILEKITERTKERIEEEKKIVPLEEVRRQAEEKGIKDQIPAFEQALRADGLSMQEQQSILQEKQIQSKQV